MRRIAGRIAAVSLLALLIVGVVIAATQDFYVPIFYVSYASVGYVLVVRRPRDFLGWLLILLAYGFITVGSSFPVDAAGLEAGTASAGDYLVVWVATWAGYLFFASFIALALLFPTGRLPERPWRRPAAALIVGAVIVSVVSAVMPTLTYNPGQADMASINVRNPFALLPEAWFRDIQEVDVLTPVALTLLVLAVTTMLARYWRATGLLKLQMRWLVAALAAIVVAIAIGLVILAVVGDDAAYAWIPAMLAYPLVPIAIGIAVLRYRLYEIDRLISRTIGWALVTALLVGAFLLLVLASTELLQPLTGGNTLAVAGSTLIVAALFAPLRGRVQRAVDRRFDRARYDGERLLAAFGLRVRDEVDLETIRADVLATVDAAVRPAHVGLWLREQRERSR